MKLRVNCLIIRMCVDRLLSANRTEFIFLFEYPFSYLPSIFANVMINKNLSNGKYRYVIRTVDY